MKFAEHLAAHITPEWRKQYISYEEMKEMLYAAIEQVPAPDQVDPDSLSRYYAKFDEKFFSFCDKELAKINTFYSGLELHLRLRLTPPTSARCSDHPPP